MHTDCGEETDTQATHMPKSFVERARHVSVIFGANLPLYSHQYAHFLLKDIKNKVFFHLVIFCSLNLVHGLLIGPKWQSPCFKAVYQSVKWNGNKASAGQAVTQHFKMGCQVCTSLTQGWSWSCGKILKLPTSSCTPFHFGVWSEVAKPNMHLYLIPKAAAPG